MSAYQLLLVLVFVVLLVILVILFLPTPGSRAKSGPSVPRGGGEPIDRGDDRYWLAGVFYNNPDDPDPIVPRRFGWGWTINLGHPFGKVVILIMLGLVLLPVAIGLLDPSFLAHGCHPSACP